MTDENTRCERASGVFVVPKGAADEEAKAGGIQLDPFFGTGAEKKDRIQTIDSVL